MADNRVQFLITASDQASAVLNGVRQSMDGVVETGKATKAEMAAAGAAITTAVVGFATVSINKFAEFEKTMSGVKAVLSPTIDEFDRLSAKARELGKTTTFTASQAAEATEMLAKNGLNATQILDGALDSTLALAAATGSDLSTSADIASSAMLVFNKNVKDLDQVVNSITGTTNVSKFGINDYALALSQGGGVAQQAGLSFEEFNAAIAAISPAFASGSDAGTSFKTFLSALTPKSNEAAVAMGELGLYTEDGKNKFYDAAGSLKNMADISQLLMDATKDLSEEQRSQALYTIFGSDAIRAAGLIAQTGADKFKQLSVAIEGTNASENAAIRLDNFK